MTSRRGFLRGLVGAAPAVLGGVTVGVDTAKGEDKTVFNFVCPCGANLVAAVPHREGAYVKIDCICGANLDLEWCGDHFKTKMRGNEHESYYA